MSVGKSEVALRAADSLRPRLAACDLCPHRCGVDRTAGTRGRCGLGTAARVASWGPHFGEEEPLVGPGGSGAVFLAGCNLACIFCQNADISLGRWGEDLTPEALARVFLELQERGCSNLNLVTPTHVVVAILDALALAEGLTLPLVWNCGGYESVDVLRALEGVVDIYMPDAKFGSDEVAGRLCGASDYWSRCREALAEMHRQVGDLIIDGRGLATRGLLVRHLVLPAGLGGTDEVLAFLAGLSTATFVNVMDQYRPCHRAHEVPELSRPPSAAELLAAHDGAYRLGLTRGPGPWSA